MNEGAFKTEQTYLNEKYRLYCGMESSDTATMQVRECVVRGDWKASQETHQKSPLEPRSHVLSHKGVLSEPDLETRLTFPPCRLLVFYHLSLGFVVFQ